MMNNYIKKISIGTAQFGMSYGISNQSGQVSYKEMKSILNLAFQNGIRSLDLAKEYGSEKPVGIYLKSQPNHLWTTTTKINNYDINVIDQLRDSKLKLGIFPLRVLAHSAELFCDLKYQNQLRDAMITNSNIKTGVSLYNKNEIIQVLDSRLLPDIVQLPINILDTKLYRLGILSELFNKGIEIHARSAFLQGLFFLSESQIKTAFGDAVPYLNKLKSLASQIDLTLSELSLLWLVSLSEISEVVIGVDNADQLKAHLHTLTKNVDPGVFDEALSVKYENNNILNPSLWP